MSRKKLLTEATVRRFMQLAGNNKYSKSFLTEAEGDEMEGEDFEIEDAEAGPPEGVDPSAEMAPEEEAADASLEGEEALSDEGGMSPDEGELEVDEEDIPSLEVVRDLLDDIISAAGGGAGMDDEGLDDDMDMDMEDDVAPEEEAMGGSLEGEDAMSAEGGMSGEDMGMEDDLGAEEEELRESILRDLNISVVPDRKIDNLVKQVMNRVTRRLVRESIRRRR